MHRISAATLKDIRSLRKTNTTILSPDFKKSEDGFRSHKNLLDNFTDVLHPLLEYIFFTSISMDDSQKSSKIKTLDEKVEMHRGEIEKNNYMIEDLNKNFESLKDQYARQSVAYEAEEKRSRSLRDEVERTNRLLRLKTARQYRSSYTATIITKIYTKHRLDETIKKLQTLEKENTELKASFQKIDEAAKLVPSLKKQIQKLEKEKQDLNAERKSQLKAKDSEIEGLKQIINATKSKLYMEENLRKNMENREVELNNLRQDNIGLALAVEKEKQEKENFRSQAETLRKQLQNSEEYHRRAKTLEIKLNEEKNLTESLKEKVKSMESKMDSVKALESKLRTKDMEIAEIRQKNHDRIEELQSLKVKFENEAKEKAAKLLSCENRLAGLESDLEVEREAVARANKSVQQLQSIKGKANQLQALYSSLLPPLQCFYCKHNLVNPITVIPCGHNYCLGCKKGYTKSCFMCTDKVKIEAVYRNELLDDIADVVKNIKELISLIK